MRLIDADALEKWIADRVRNYHKSFPDWRKTHPISVETALMELDCIKDVVRESPTIDAVPVVHARWVHRCRYIATEIWEWRCSACGELPPGPNQLAYELRYCPHCGAKMDAKEGES